MSKKPPSAEKTVLTEIRLPKELRDKLCSRQLMAMLEQAWLEAFARGIEFGTTLAAEAARSKKAKPKRKRRS